jgi:hypothetical protein
MRPVVKPGIAPLPKQEMDAMLTNHIPYRLTLLRDGYLPPGATLSQPTNQAFEAGAVSGRILLSLLGLKVDRKHIKLKPDQDHDAKDGKTDDVKARDIGGEFVNPDELPEHEREILAQFIHGVNKACAHFTIGSEHKLDRPFYAEAASIIFRLMAERFPDHAVKWPKWIRSSA